MLVHIRHMSDDTKTSPPPSAAPETATRQPVPEQRKVPVEIGGPAGPEPTRYGDWERNGRCTDF